MERRLCRWGAVLLLGAFFAVALSSAAVKSPTVDEGGKLAMGYSFLRTGSLRFQGVRNNPRLAEAWAALPLILDPRVPPLSEVPGWDRPRSFFSFVANFYYRSPDVVRYALVSRIQIILLGVLLGALVFRWASEWFGSRAGLLACFLCTFSPNVIAHSRLVTNDLPTALGALATMYMLQRLLRRPSLPRAALTGLVLGGALLVKYTTMLLVPAIAVLLLAAAWFRNWPWTMWPDLDRRKALMRGLGLACVLFGLAALAVWAGFGFEVRLLKRVDFPLPIPAASVIDDLIRLRQVNRGGWPSFLLGHLQGSRRWYYYLATILFKTPPPSLFLFAVASAGVVIKRRLIRQLPLWLFPGAYFLFNVVNGFNIGHRHLLPVLPFGFVLAGQVIPLVYDRLRVAWAKLCGLLLIAWYLGVSLWIYPDYLAYFNLFAGGPARGYQVLLDSNLDWGQDLVQLRRYMEEKGLDEVWLSAMGLTDPARYGIRYRKLPDWENKEIQPDFHYLNPDPGVYVIGATLLQGVYLPNLSTFDWFLRREPIDQIGYSMLVYRVEEDAVPPAWLGMCYAPDPPLSPDELAAGFGRTDLRVVYFDCRSSWVVPGEGTPGWHVIPPPAERPSADPVDWLGEESLEKVFEQRNYEGGRDFTVYKADGDPSTLSGLGSPVLVLPTGARPDQPSSVTGQRPPRLSPPLELDGPVTFLGYQLDVEMVEPGEALTVRTLWKAKRAVTETLLSVFVHLVGGSGDTWSVGDALDFPPVQWQDGDVFVQRHTLELPLDTPRGTYWIACGLYDAVAGVRYTVRAGETEADAFWFGPVVIGGGL